jgi:hypothetical protein
MCLLLMLLVLWLLLRRLLLPQQLLLLLLLSGCFCASLQGVKASGCCSCSTVNAAGLSHCCCPVSRSLEQGLMPCFLLWLLHSLLNNLLYMWCSHGSLCFTWCVCSMLCQRCSYCCQLPAFIQLAKAWWLCYICLQVFQPDHGDALGSYQLAGHTQKLAAN